MEVNCPNCNEHIQEGFYCLKCGHLPTWSRKGEEVIYLIGSMRNPKIPVIANKLRAEGFDIFDDWYSPGKNADDEWQAYELARGRTYREALNGEHAREVFEFDKQHLDKAESAVLVAPAGKSGHIELGYMVGKGKPAFVLMEQEPERFDIMYRFATRVCLSLDELKNEL